MTEEHIGLLFKAATIISKSESNESYKILKSHYLMRCKELTRGYGLPKKHFSEKTRCAFCCLEWNNKAKTKVNSVKLSKQQRRRIRAKSKKTNLPKNENLLYCNEMERKCSFCNKSIKIPLLKPNKPHINIVEQISDLHKEPNMPNQKTKVKLKHNQQIQSNVYCKSNVAFSLYKNNNTLSSTVKEQPKVIKNNKKKKDKFAGLCQKAVIAATKLKQEKTKENKLNLFLKPSI